MSDTTVPMPTAGKPERQHWLEWMVLEQSYEENKYGGERDIQDADMAVNGFLEEGYWFTYIMRYLGAARIYSQTALDPEIGEEGQIRARQLAQQAMAKTLMTVRGAVESSIRVWGSLPAPGVPSGEIVTAHA